MIMAELPLVVAKDSVLEINYVMNVTTVLDETAASDRVSRFMI